MVETPKLSSLAGELLKFFLLSSFLLGLLISFVLFFLGKINVYYALGAGFTISTAWVLFNILWTKSKLEELFGRLLYVIDILEEKHREKAVVPIPIYEEVLGIVDSIRELVKNFEEKYEKEIRELEDQIETISENASKILVALEKVQDGRLKTEFPSGLDPVGAIGQAMQQICSLYLDKLSRIKSVIKECREELEKISLLLGDGEDKIDVRKVKEGIEKIIKAEEAIEEELRFFKDIKGG